MQETDSLEARLTTTLIGRPTRRLSSVTSTNDYIKEAAAGGLSQGTAVYTLRQTAGRGRRGREWNDGGGKSVSLSVYITGISTRATAELSLYCGMAVLEALEQITGHPCALKWPNDVLLRDRKVSGILCEGFLADGQWSAVMGMGINLYQSAADFARADLPYAGSLLSETGKRYAPEMVVAAVLNRLEEVLLVCETDGFSAIREYFERKCIHIGRQVRVLYKNSQRTGIATGIDRDGSLLVSSGGEILSIQSGEASIRGMFGYIE